MFTGILPNEIPHLWKELVPYIEKPLKRTNALKYYSPDDVLLKCYEEKWQCWAAIENDKIDCIFITYITLFPTGHRVFTIYLVGGNNINNWLEEAWNTLKAYAREKGCTELVGLGRQGWLRKLKEVEPNTLEEHMRFSVEI